MRLLQTVAHLYHPRRSNNHRARVLHPEVLAIFSLMLIAAFTTVYASMSLPGRLGSVLGYASNISVTDVVSQTNQKRELSGLGSLKLNDRLSQAAAAKAQDMFSKQYWAHTAPDGTQPWHFMRDAGYSYQVAGENLARDFAFTNEMVDAWMASPTHRANVMNARYTEIGVAAVNGTLDGVETTLVVQMFGLPRTALAQVPAAVGQRTSTGVAEAEVVTSPVPTASSDTPTLAQDQSEPEVRTISQLSPSTQGETVIVPDQPTPAVLASALLPQGTLSMPPLFTPLQIIKAVFLAVIMMLTFTLVYDSVVTGNRQVVRLVGHNLSHVLLFAIVTFLLISFKAGVLG